MIKIPKKRYIFSIIFSVIFLYTLAFSSFLYKKDYWRNLLLEKTTSLIQYKLLYSSENLIFFPTPGLELYDVSIENFTAENTFKLECKKIIARFSWKNILLQKWKLDELDLSDGHFDLDIKIDPKNKNQDSIESLKNINIKNIQILSIQINNFDINLNYNKYEYKFLLNKFIYNHQSLLNNSIDLNLDYMGGNFDFKSDLGLDSHLFHIENIIAKGKLTLSKFPIKVLYPLYKILNKSNFSSGLVNGNISFEKESDGILEAYLNLTCYNLNFLNLNPYPPLEISSNILFNNRDGIIQFINTSIQQGKNLKSKIKGELRIQKRIYLQLEISADTIELEKTLEYVLAFTDFTLPPQATKIFESDLHLKVNMLSYRDYSFGESEADIRIDDTRIRLDIVKASLHSGLITGEGIIDATKTTTYDLTFHVSNLIFENFLQRYTDKKYISGNLKSDFHLHSIGDSYSEFEKNLKIRGFISIKNGKLMGYANFLKPILSLGKLVNFLGPKGESGEFQSLETHFFIEKRSIDIPDMKMVGVGLDANGKGYANFEKEVDFRITVGLGGIAGKALFIPIIYKGYFNKNFAYIDPIWLGSVYLGATIAGPVGVTAGGVAGSFATEYIRSTIDSIKNIFSFGNNKIIEEEK